MNRTVYLNGEYLVPDQAKVSIFDRGILFGDAVYEVAGVLDGKLIDFSNHMARLKNSLASLSIKSPLTEQEILSAYRKLVLLNNIREGLVYMQITRGEAERDFVWQQGLKPTVFMFTQPKPNNEYRYSDTGVSLHSTEDLRWARRDIKSVNLLGQVLAKQKAHQSGAYEALLIDRQGFITECGSTSFFMIKNQTIMTRPLSNQILPGVTRKAIVTLATKNNLSISQSKFTLKQVYQADEAFITGASSYVIPVTKIDDRAISTGRPGPLTLKLKEIYLDTIHQTLI